MNSENFSPLLRLYKYRPSIKNTPCENFLTESFAICLFHNPDIAKKFLHYFAEIITEKDVLIDTQVKSDDEKSIFDMKLTDNVNYAVFIECKLGAGISKDKSSNIDQIEKYVAYISKLPIKNKKLLLIEQVVSSIRDIKDIPFTTVRWNNIKEFLESQSGESEIGEFIRLSFLDLLIHLKVNRKLIGNRLSWKCSLCGLETIGQGIYSHKKKHESEEKYKRIINNLNDQKRNNFNNKITPYKHIFSRLKISVNSIGKIDKNNFVKRQEITKLLTENLPKEIWLLFIDELEGNFSNKAFIDYRDEIEKKLIYENIQLIVKPNYLMINYDNILKYLNK